MSRRLHLGFICGALAVFTLSCRQQPEAQKQPEGSSMSAFVEDYFNALFEWSPSLATSIGSQAQKPLAIVVVGGMLCTLFLTRYLMPVLYSFFPGPRDPVTGTEGTA